MMLEAAGRTDVVGRAIIHGDESGWEADSERLPLTNHDRPSTRHTYTYRPAILTT